MRCRRSLRTNSSKDWCNAPPKDLVRRFGYCRVGEFVAATRGLGYLLSFAQSTYNAALMFPERRGLSHTATDARNLKECVAMDIPHELRDEFPQEISLIERMIRTNYEFRRLAERYAEVNRNIYRIESGEEPTTDEVLARLKKWRLKLKDEIAAILTKLEHRM